MTRFPQTRGIGTAILVMLLAGAGFPLAGCGEQEPRDAAVEDLRLMREYNGDQVLEGVFVNTAGKHIRGARIRVELFEADSLRPADTMSFEIHDIEPGERKVFRETIDTRRHLSGARLGRIVLF